MNDNAIKNYAVWARRELMSEVAKRCAWWGISEDAQADVESVDGRVLSAQERKQRTDLLHIVKSDGYDQLVEKAAYTWFNRLLAIRFMEVNDRLPSHVRILSSASGDFEPQCLREALDLPLDALDKDEAVKLVQAGDDEALFRLVFLAQCAELAECMPAVFEKVGSAMELLLPTGLLRRDGVVGQLVEQIPEDDWREGVEIVGWMYQYYVSERKDEVFASFKKGKKAERDAIAPATQLFTPHWIVRYLTENSLGRLWMLNHLDSKLVEKMPYFIKPDEEHETEFRRISSPEEITCVDPACGSGHILVYAFELLAAMYEEAGYSNRDAARLIVEKNLTGLEIDPRAAAMASFALTMKACELDSRFLRRGVQPRITVLERIEFEPDELAQCPNLAERTTLLDAVAHLDECGSLLRPEHDDLAAIERDLASLADGASLFAGSAGKKLERLLAELRSLAERYDVMVANPPYMGSNNMNIWLNGWTKKNYAETCKDLCTCFIKRGMILAAHGGYEALITSDTCMYISSFEKLRKMLIDEMCIIAFIDTRGTNAHPDVFDANAGWVLWNSKDACAKGAYFKLNQPIAEKEARYLEALANSECGWFFSRDAKCFALVPGSPIAYWVSSAMQQSFAQDSTLETSMQFKTGMVTGDNDRFLRLWWEVPDSETYLDAKSNEDAQQSGKRWFPYNKGGEFRRWYGNNDYLINYANEGHDIFSTAKAEKRAVTNMLSELRFKTTVTWSLISSSIPSFRIKDHGFLYDKAGLSFYPPSKEDALYSLGLCNSSFSIEILRMLAPTMNFQLGDIWRIPYIKNSELENVVLTVVSSCLQESRLDWDASETSWDFRRHPLI